MTAIDLTPTLTPPGRETWLAIGELVRLIGNDEWIVVGGQMVAIHASRFGVTPARPTTDGDLVVDVRVYGRTAMRRVSDALVALRFIVEISPEGVTRFTRGSAKVDLLAPEVSAPTSSPRRQAMPCRRPEQLRRSSAQRRSSPWSTARRLRFGPHHLSERSSRRLPPTRFRRRETNACVINKISRSCCRSPRVYPSVRSLGS